MYRFERISPALLADLWYLKNAEMPDSGTQDELAAKFATQNQGAAYVGYLAYDEVTGSPAAYYGVFPVRVRMQGRTILAAQSGDTITHPDHRGRGLFVKLAKQTYELAESLGIEFVFGYPNSSSYPGFVRKLDWQHPYNMNSWNAFVPTLPIRWLASRNVAVSRLHARFFERLSSVFFNVEDVSKFAESAPQRPGVIHDEHFIEYKRKSGFLLRYKSATFWVKLNDSLEIGTVSADATPRHIWAGLLRLYLVSGLSGIFRIKSYFSPNSQHAANFRGFGMVRPSLPYGFIQFNDRVEPEKLETVYVDYDTF